MRPHPPPVTVPGMKRAPMAMALAMTTTPESVPAR